MHINHTLRQFEKRITNLASNTRQIKDINLSLNLQIKQELSDKNETEVTLKRIMRAIQKVCKQIKQIRREVYNNTILTKEQIKQQQRLLTAVKRQLVPVTQESVLLRH